MSLFGSLGKLAKGAVKGVTASVKVVGQAASVVQKIPGVNAAVMLIPGAGQLSAGISVANSLVSAAKKGGNQAKQAQAIINNTKKIAANPNTPPAARAAAINALTVVKKQVAATKTVAKHRVSPNGFVVRVS